ncbi:MAG: hypothetical protein ACOX3R_13845 [Desulfitobacteriia bacterium]
MLSFICNPNKAICLVILPEELEMVKEGSLEGQVDKEQADLRKENILAQFRSLLKY